MKTHLLILSAILIMIVACTKPASQEQADAITLTDQPVEQTEAQTIVDVFNNGEYGFTFQYSEGQYSLHPNEIIASSDIRDKLKGKEWDFKIVGFVQLAGLSLASIYGGGMSIQFTETVAHVVVIPDNPSEAYIEKDVSVVFGDNRITVGDITYIICSFSDKEFYCLVDVSKYNNIENYWYYYRCSVIEEPEE